MNACENFSRHCLWPEAMEQSVCCGGTTYNYPNLYDFNATDTWARECCLVGVQNEPNRPCQGQDIFSEDADGRWCGHGCKDCEDDVGLYGSSKLAHLGENVDGGRWLAAYPDAGRRYWDARGLLHDLKSNEFHPVPGRIVYHRGTCWVNPPEGSPNGMPGTECFGEDVCGCFGDNTTSPHANLQNKCDDVWINDQLPGFLPDEFFRAGYQWPPQNDLAGGDTQTPDCYYCRMFGDSRLPPATLPSDPEITHRHTTVTGNASEIGGMNRLAEGLMEPMLFSSNVCQSDRLADCAGVFTPRSPCYFFSAHGICTECHWFVEGCPDSEPCDNTHYNSDWDSRRKFNFLGIVGNDDPPHIVSPTNGQPSLTRSTAAWKNKILKMVRETEFPLPAEEGGAERTTRFDRLDHMVNDRTLFPSNSGVGIFQRGWSGWESRTMIPVPNASGMGRLRQAGCVFDYKTWLARVRIVCRLILQQYHGEGGLKYILPMVRLHIMAVTTIGVGNLRRPGTIETRWTDTPCSFTGAHDGETVFLEVRNRRGLDGFIPTVYGSPLEPREWPPPIGGLGDVPGDPGEAVDYGEGFMFFDDDGKQFIPSQIVEWRGFLGGNSKPTAQEQARQMGTTFNTCANVATFFAGIKVPGWPTHVDSPIGPDEDPAGIYGGHLRLELTSG